MELTDGTLTPRPPQPADADAAFAAVIDSLPQPRLVVGGHTTGTRAMKWSAVEFTMQT